MKYTMKLGLSLTIVLAAGAAGMATVWLNVDAEVGPTPPAITTSETVTVSRQDITSVVSLDASVVANAEYLVTAPKAGIVSHVFDPASAGPAPRLPTVHPHWTSLSPDEPTPTPSGDPTAPPDDPEDPGETEEPEKPDKTEKADIGPVPVTAKLVLARVADKNVPVPVDGVFTEWLVPHGTKVAKGVPIARLTYTGFALVGQLPAADTYRLLSGKLSATAAVTDGPAGFDCRLLQAPSTAPADSEKPTPQVVCAVDDEVRLFPDLAGIIAIHSGQVEDVLALPVTAISGTADVGEVTVVNDDGSTEVREVKLGATDGTVVEIVDGLTEGDVVSASPPPLVR
ncbi:hypothetical protein [Stackebrandtia soli]|uniref:hypothetical protein n=1 Tax=Stackebrandtia soli TaxID=1892856 RepID=UPI0039E9A11C